MKMNGKKEAVLYYTPEHSGNAVKLKGVLVRMGVRIRNVAPEQVNETIGSLLGLAGSRKADGSNGGEDEESASQSSAQDELAGGTAPFIPEEVLVMHNFTSGRLDELLLNLRKAGVPRIALKAVVTETNAAWTFYQLYEEIREEHEKMEETGR